MLKIIGAIIIIITSVSVGHSFSDNIKKRITNIKSLAEFIDYVSTNITLYKSPLDEIFSETPLKYLHECGFVSQLDKGIFTAASGSGMLAGDEEKEIIKSFSDKIGTGTAEDIAKLCSFTSSRLRNIEEQLSRDLPDKQRVYNTISLLAGASAIIILI